MGLEERCQKGYKTHPTRKTKTMYGKTYRNCVKAEGEDIETAAKNAVKEYYVLREIYGEDKLPISNITRMDKIVDK